MKVHNEADSAILACLKRSAGHPARCSLPTRFAGIWSWRLRCEWLEPATIALPTQETEESPYQHITEFSKVTSKRHEVGISQSRC
jgi:hypothetical protein